MHSAMMPQADQKSGASSFSLSLFILHAIFPSDAGGIKSGIKSNSSERHCLLLFSLSSFSLNFYAIFPETVQVAICECAERFKFFHRYLEPHIRVRICWCQLHSPDINNLPITLHTI